MDRKEFEERKAQFLDYLKNNKKVAENTLKAYQADLFQFLVFWQDQADKNAQESNLENMLHVYISTLFEQINKSSIARKISCFSSFKKFLKRVGISLAVNLKRPVVPPKIPVALPVNNIFFLLDKTQDDQLPTKRPLRDKAILELLYATGVCVSELVMIELAHINFAQQAITIRSKRKRERTVYFGQQALDRLRAYISIERPVSESPNERLFLNCRNKPLTVRSIQRICQMFRQLLVDQENITPGLLRNSFATHMLNQGADLITMQKLLGHKIPMSTQRYKQNQT